MQSTYSTQFPEQEHLKCPRCESSNTKFCYYNNYNLSQPRHFCKNCKRYWTKGGTLRNIPVGGGSRKNNKRPSKPKRSSTDHPKQEIPPSSTSTAVYNSSIPASSELNQGRSVLLDMGGSFSSLLEGDGQFGNNVFDGLNSNGSPGLQFGENPMSSGLGSNLVGNPAVEFENSKNSERFPGIENDGDSSCWSSAINGWSDLAMYAPAGSSFQ